MSKVAVLLGGNSAERPISLLSGEAVLRGLIAGGIDAHAFDPAERPLEDLHREGFDKVFIALHGRGGEDGTVQGALEWLGIPYTGSRVLGSALAMDKVRTKQIWQSLGLPTADFWILEKGLLDDTLAADIMTGPVMVKPSREGSSLGMKKASTVAELKDAVAEAVALDDVVLVERWINGPEFTVGILDNQPLPVIQMKTPNGFYDYQAKYQSNTTQYLIPCGLPAEQEDALKVLSMKAFHAVGAEGWGRVDAMLDEHGHFQLLEVNTVPGMTEKSLVPKAAKATGMDFSTLVCRILASAR
ncbi:D-alanine--D-alanine ligase [Gallaecimonas pentaromativorans]|uniref:D-alanine--D-alanine ligase n=1 Tax=Gallaecimonas pentaromativorans TaxID=584787 RepID=A0A3N1PRV3_9GAMM|nr:D-alanine--D-alanine ligase [Gallaecimonas pentaromativorans]ROQ30768.1 D-alanine--D-alanine ligase [Gallaecimonas pentaromativorans]